MVRICDRSECPAPALHDLVLHGQDFHFCGHHWAELSSAVRAGQPALDRPVPSPADARSSATRGGLFGSGRRRLGVGER